MVDNIDKAIDPSGKTELENFKTEVVVDGQRGRSWGIRNRNGWWEQP